MKFPLRMLTPAGSESQFGVTQYFNARSLDQVRRPPSRTRTMKRVVKICLAGAAVALSTISNGFAWTPVAGHMMTKYADSVNPNLVWPEYPRPQLVRSQWTNLNGLW